MSIKSLECPKCGGKISFEEGKKISFCTYCGTPIEYDDGTTSEERVTKEKIKADVEKTEMNFKYLVINKLMDSFNEHAWIILMMVILIIAFMLIQCTAKHYGDADPKAPEGYVQVKSCKEYEDQNYEVVEAELEALGFKNIKTVDLNDAGLFKKENTIESISIKGNNYFSSSDYFNPETDQVVISYH